MMRAPILMLPFLVACGSGIPKDADVMATECTVEHFDDFELASAVVDGDTLTLNVTYTGGVRQHAWYICWDGYFEENDPETFSEANPPRTRVSIGHRAYNDPGDELIESEPYSFDIAPIRQDYEATHDNGADRLVIVIDDAQDVQYPW